MIAKNIKGKSFKGCISYVMNDTATILEAEGIWVDNTKNIIRSFAMQRSGRKEIKQPVGHIPISFSPEDKDRMTNEFMVQLAKEYMQEMGIKNTQYIIVRHDNTENPHLHIVYNRINNDLKLISVNHDYKRNIKVCKKLKDKYNLTYGKGKEKVKREKLDNPDKIKYKIYDAIKAVLPYCKNPADLRLGLEKYGIEIEYKWKRTVREIEGVSFRYGNVAFKGSKIDRKFSFSNLKKEFQKNIIGESKRAEKEYLRELEEQKTRQKVLQKAKRETEEKSRKEVKAKFPLAKRNFVINGVELTDEQQKTLLDGGNTFLENMNHSDGKHKFSAYAFLSEEKNRVFFSGKNPDEFVKYGKYEMRIRDKILIEDGQITKATVKWYGYGNNAHPYLWKRNKSDTEYLESWGDPSESKEQKQEKQDDNRNQIPLPNKKRGRGI